MEFVHRLLLVFAPVTAFVADAGVVADRLLRSVAGANWPACTSRYPNQDSFLLRHQRSVLGIDVWEHAYYMKYQNKGGDYLAAVTKVINWDFISERSKALAK